MSVMAKVDLIPKHVLNAMEVVVLHLNKEQYLAVFYQKQLAHIAMVAELHMIEYVMNVMVKGK